MTIPPPFPALPGDQIVQGPRVTDAIGGTLRRAFDDGLVPRDMMQMLDRIGASPRRF